MSGLRAGDDRGRDIATFILLGAFFAAVIAHYIASEYLGHQYPYNTFLYRPDEGNLAGPTGPRGVGGHLFGDFFQVWAQTRQPSPYQADSPYLVSVYPPFAHLVLRPLTWMRYDIAVVVFLTLGVAALIWLGYRSLPGARIARMQAAVIVALTSYPVLFAMDRGNIDLLVVLMLWVAFVPGMLPDRSQHWCRPVLLGASVAFKLYPGLYLLVLLRQRKWRESFIAGAAACVFTIIALLSFGRGLRTNVSSFYDSVYTFAGFSSAERGDRFVQHSPTLRATAQALVSFVQLPESLVHVVSTAAVVLGLLILCAVTLLPLQLWQQLYLIATVATTCLAGAHDYRLILFILPLIVRLQQPTDARAGRDLMTIALTLVLVPKSLPILYDDVTVGVILNPILIVATAAVIAAVGLGNGLAPSGRDANARGAQAELMLGDGRAAAGVEARHSNEYRSVPWEPSSHDRASRRAGS